MKKIEIFFRKLVLKLLLILKGGHHNMPLPVIDKSSKLLFVRLNRIGDALVTTPLLSKIKEQYDCHITVLADDKNYFVFEKCSFVDEVLVYKKKSQSLFSLINLLNHKNFDIVADLHDDVSTTVSIIISFLQIKYKFGFSKGTSKLYSHVIPKPDPSSNHVIDRLMDFRKLFDFSIESNEINVKFESTVSDIEKTDFYLGNNFQISRFLLGINISAGSEARFWGTENYQLLIKSLKQFKINILILCSEKDLEFALKISDGKHPVFHTSDFNEFATMINNLNFLFSPDTSIIHIASAFRVPVFGLYVKYNTEDQIWYPYKSKYDAIITEEPNLNNVTFKEVENKFIPFFESIYYGAK